MSETLVAPVEEDSGSTDSSSHEAFSRVPEHVALLVHSDEQPVPGLMGFDIGLVERFIEGDSFDASGDETN